MNNNAPKKHQIKFTHLKVIVVIKFHFVSTPFKAFDFVKSYLSFYITYFVLFLFIYFFYICYFFAI